MGLGIAVLVNGAPDPQLPEPSSVVVHERMGEMTTYRLRYPADIARGDLPMLTAGSISAGSELSIISGSGAKTACLVKGPVYGQQIHLVHGGAGSYVDVLGADTSIKMDRESKAAVWSNVRDSDVIRTILQQNNYTLLDLEDTPATHGEDKHTLVQTESDLRFVQRLARRNGCLFWITSNDKGIETAHFRRPPVDGKPAGELLINLNAASLNSLDITWDVERPTSTVALQLDLNTKTDIDGSAAQSPLRQLGSQSFSSIATGARSLRLVTPLDDAGDLTARSEAALIEASFFVYATCQTSLTAVKSLLRSHTLVNLRGAGSRHSGTYFCAGVRHVIDNNAHRMEVEMVRNGWGA